MDASPKRQICLVGDLAKAAVINSCARVSPTHVVEQIEEVVVEMDDLVDWL